MSDAPQTPSRRSLLAAMAAAGAGLGALGHALAWGTALVPKVLYEPPTSRRIGPPSRFSKGITYLADERVFVIRDDRGLRALSAVCTHLGCTVGRDSGAEGGFHCPCHGSRFAADGANRAGPAPRPLPWRPLTLAPDGTVVVDLAAEVGADAVLAVGKPG